MASTATKAVLRRAGQARRSGHREDYELALTDSEKAQLDKSAASVRELIDVLKQKAASEFDCSGAPGCFRASRGAAGHPAS